MKYLNTTNHQLTNLSAPIVIFSLFVLGSMLPLVAWSHCDGKHSGSHPHCDGDSGTGSTLEAEFCLNMTVEIPGLASDGQLAPNEIDDYCHDRKERVMAFTGSGTGFRFDSNTKSRPPLRWVEINFPGGTVTALDDDRDPLTTFDSGDYQIDFRFNRGNGGLDLGGMLIDGETGTPEYFVPLNVWFDSLNGIDRFALAYSEDTDPLNSSDLKGNICVRENTLNAQVKRLGPGWWSIESHPDEDRACLWDWNFDPGAYLENQSMGTPVDMPFYFEIEIK